MPIPTQMTIAPRGMSWHGDKLQNNNLGALVRPTTEQIAEYKAAFKLTEAEYASIRMQPK